MQVPPSIPVFGHAFGFFCEADAGALRAVSQRHRSIVAGMCAVTHPEGAADKSDLLEGASARSGCSSYSKE
eukprot:14890845-Alexandrium_andersonii.AAC.1